MFRLRFIHCALVSPFILPFLPFSLTGERKDEKSLWRGVDELYSFYLLRHANAKCTCAWLHNPLKLLPLSTLLSCYSCTDYGFKSPGWFDVETRMHVLSWAVIWQYSWCYQASTTIMIDYKIVSLCTDYVTDYKIRNILCLNK